MRERNAGIIYCSYSHTGFQSDGAGSLESTLEDKNLGEPPEASMPLRDDIVVCRRDKDKLWARHAVPLRNEGLDAGSPLGNDAYCCPRDKLRNGLSGVVRARHAVPLQNEIPDAGCGLRHAMPLQNEILDAG